MIPNYSVILTAIAIRIIGDPPSTSSGLAGTRLRPVVRDYGVAKRLILAHGYQDYNIFESQFMLNNKVIFFLYKFKLQMQC